MKVIVIGATGTIGVGVVAALEGRHEVVRASRGGSVKVDLDDAGSIDALFASVRDVDAVVCAAANAPLTPIERLTDEDVAAGLRSKLLGQVSLVRRALREVRDDGSITLTAGTFVDHIPGSAVGAIVNSGLEGFVRSAAPEMPRGIRLNVVSPGWIQETLDNLGLKGYQGTPMSEVAQTYAKVVEGTMRGQTLVP
ncbi:short chain dehydrogenase [Streptosporangium sp. KLBMP 9127]|nr:short chain dehydrogenase [Streptosporangium sp. KLBMP 9127]